MDKNNNKLQKIMLKYNLNNTIKVCIIIIVLFLIYQLFTTPSVHNITQTLQYNNNMCNGKYNDNNKYNDKYINTIENFESNGDEYYGNQIILNSLDQLPIYSDNKCTFIFNDIYRLESLQIRFNTEENANSQLSIYPYKNGLPLPIYIQYYDGDGNLKYIKSNTSPYISTGSPPIFKAINNNINITNIIDENNLIIYTSKIVISVGSISNKIEQYNSSKNIDDKYNKYIKSFVFYGSVREMPTYTEYNKFNTKLTRSNFTLVSNNTNTNNNKYNYTSTQDLNIYSIKLSYYISSIPPPIQLDNIPITPLTPLTPLIYEPATLNISYNNSIYPGNTFKINTKYYIRTDPQNIITPYYYIYFTEPIIANSIMISVESNLSNNKIVLLTGNITTHSENTNLDIISNYKRTVNTLLNNTSQDTQLNVCPSLDIIVKKQNQVQQLCDNLDYQDKIASEKIRLEKNKQYLLKLQEQQQQIDQLNNVLTTLDTKRAQRSKNSDIARVLQYQQQKNTASTIIDLANQRLESQDNNQLYLDVNINSNNITTTTTPSIME